MPPPASTTPTRSTPKSTRWTCSPSAPEPASLGAAANDGSRHDARRPTATTRHDDHATTTTADAGDHHDAHDDHGHDGPHESGPLILVPIVILAILSATVGLLNATPIGEDWERFKLYIKPRPTPVDRGVSRRHRSRRVGRTRTRWCSPTWRPTRVQDEDGHARRGRRRARTTGCGFDVPTPAPSASSRRDHAEPTLPKIMLSIGVVARLPGRDRVLRRVLRTPQQASRRTHRALEVLRGGYLFLENKYYLDALYEKRHRPRHRPPDRRRRVLDQPERDRRRSSTASARAPRSTGDWVYRNVDQTVVDGAVNGSGHGRLRGTGHALQPVQSGKVNQYGALLFGAAAVGALVLVIVN